MLFYIIGVIVRQFCDTYDGARLFQFCLWTQLFSTAFLRSVTVIWPQRRHHRQAHLNLTKRHRLVLFEIIHGDQLVQLKTANIICKNQSKIAFLSSLIAHKKMQISITPDEIKLGPYHCQRHNGPKGWVLLRKLFSNTTSWSKFISEYPQNFSPKFWPLYFVILEIDLP